MAWNGKTITKLGRDLIAKAQTGVQLKFTRCKIGDGYVQENPDNLKDLVNTKKECPISSVKIKGDGTAGIEVQLFNKGIVDGFSIREIGVFAQDPDVGEILLYYINYTDNATWFPPEALEVIEAVIEILIAISNASNVTAVINESLIFVTKKEFDALKFLKSVSANGKVVDATKFGDSVNFIGKGEIKITVNMVSGVPTVYVDDGATDDPVWDKFRWDKQRWGVAFDEDLRLFINDFLSLSDEELKTKYNSDQIELVYKKIENILNEGERKL